jgi:hypothetical protein
MSNRRLTLRPDDPTLALLIERQAASSDVPRRPLQLQSLLHLPRLAQHDRTVDLDEAAGQVEELATTLPPRQKWRAQGDVATASTLSPRAVSEMTAREICERFHYLRSHRVSSTYLGLFAGGERRPVALVVLSPFDMTSLIPLLPRGVDQARIGVVSRVFAFEGVPRNTISRLLSFARTIAVANGTEALITYVNPNLGFTGVSYRASGWHLSGDQPGTTYRYLDGRYVTDRYLADQFGAGSPNEWARLLGRRYSTSKMPLDPLLVFTCDIRRHVRLQHQPRCR